MIKCTLTYAVFVAVCNIFNNKLSAATVPFKTFIVCFVVDSHIVMEKHSKNNQGRPKIFQIFKP